MSQILDPSNGQGTEFLAGDVVDCHMESATHVELRNDDAESGFDNSLRGTGGPNCS